MRLKNPLVSRLLANGHSAFLAHVDSKIVGLTLLNAFLFWPWHWLKAAYDAGERHPQLVLGMMALTSWTWWQLLTAIVKRVTAGGGRR